MDQLQADGDKKLSDLFGEVWDVYQKIVNSAEASASSTVQQDVSRALDMLDLLKESVEHLGMFSSNEEIDEVVTSDLRFFLVSALSASLSSRKACSIANRCELLITVEKLYLKFLKMCFEYSIGPLSEIERLVQPQVKPVSSAQAGNRDLQALSATRDAKIAKHRRSKLRIEKLKDLESHLHDDESQREYWLLQIDKWIDYSLDEISSLRTELQMLEHMKNTSRSEIQQVQNDTKSRKPMKPFILTKDRLQASVFGAGYPSLPTVTLEEYFEREAAAGRMPDQASKPASSLTRDDVESDSDDEEKLKKQRDMDDWKDTHRRGAGNRKNMG